MSRAGTLRFAALLLALVAGAGLQPRPAAAVPARATVDHLSGGLVYLDAGRREGLAEGDSLVVVREGRPVAWLRATYLSSHRVACDTLRTLAPLRVGDVAEFTARPAAPAEGAAPAAAGADTAHSAPGARGAASGPGAAARRPAPRSRMRGRVGVAYLMVDTQGSGRLSQGSLDARLDGTQLWGAPVDVSLDLRGRRTTFERVVGGSQVDDLTRVYRFNVAAHDATGRRLVTFGRQVSSSLSSVSIFDGALAESRGERWSGGLFLGTQPEPVHLGLSGSIVEWGGFLEWHQPVASERRWSLAGGLISSQQGGQPNRDFAFAQAYYTDRAFSASASQEVDVNRGWRRDQGQATLSATSSLVSLNLRALPWLSVRGGYDNRRNVRLYRDHITPETEFDDRFRQGAWTGVSLDRASHLRLGADVRTSAIGGAERVTSWSGNAEIYRIGAVNGALRVRLNRARGAGVATDLVSLGGGLDPLPGCHLEAAGGVRTTDNPLLSAQDRVRWASGSLDLTVARQGYFNFSIERDADGLSPSTQVYSGLSWRY